jgi:hypothetical protein
MTTHGMWGSPTYVSWAAMRRRCTDKNYWNYRRYGGRGVSIDPAWTTFAGFLADMGARPSGTSIDRIDNDGDYNAANCRWATWGQQMQNKGIRKDNTSGVAGVYWHKLRQKWVVRIQVDGKTMHLGQFSELGSAAAARKAGELKHWGAHMKENEDG